MSKVNLEAPFQSFQGKICKHTDIIYKKMYGKSFTSKICNPYTGDPSAAQADLRTKFKNAWTAVQNISAEQRATYLAEFKKQTKYKTLNGYIFAQEYAKL